MDTNRIKGTLGSQLVYFIGTLSHKMGADDGLNYVVH